LIIEINVLTQLLVILSFWKAPVRMGLWAGGGLEPPRFIAEPKLPVLIFKGEFLFCS